MTIATPPPEDLCVRQRYRSASGPYINQKTPNRPKPTAYDELPTQPTTPDRTFYSYDPLPHIFTGKERDSESGLDYFGARYYGSALGRWTSPDEVFADQHPQDPQSWNLYVYVRNNALRFYDDAGRAAQEAAKKTLLDLMRYSSSQVAGRAGGAGTLLELPVTEAFSAPSSIPVFRGGLDKGRELDEARHAAEYSGMTFVGAPRRNFPGVDGIFLQQTWLGFGEYKGIPVSLKGFDQTPTANDVAGAATQALDQLQRAQKSLGVDINNAQVFIHANQLTADQVTGGKNFAKIAATTTTGTVDKVVIFVNKGQIVCQNGKCK